MNAANPPTAETIGGKPTWPRENRFALVSLVVLLAAIALVRARFLSLPFERDEGEYAYAARLLLDGLLPYAHVYNMKLPGAYASYAAIFALLGESVRSVRLGHIAVNLATTAIAFLWARRHFSAMPALVASAVFGGLSLGRDIQGLFANAEVFLLLPAMIGLWLVWPAQGFAGKRNLILAGVTLGLAFVIKQQAAIYIAWAAAFVALRHWHLGASKPRAVLNAALLLAAAAMPFAITCAAFAFKGHFAEMWFWTFTYSRQYVSQAGLADAWVNFKHYSPFRTDNIVAVVWLAALAGCVVASLRPQHRAKGLVVASLLAASACATGVGLYFRPHYFALMLPAIAMSAAAGTAAIASWLRSRSPSFAGASPAIIAIATMSIILAGNASYLFSMSPMQVSRATFGFEPFPEAVVIGRWLEEHTTPDQTIAVVGSEPEIYFHANRRAATGFIYMYALMERHPFAKDMQRRLREEIEANCPEYVLFVATPSSWNRTPESDLGVLEWFTQYREAHYERVGLIDIVSEDRTEYYWGDASRRNPQSRIDWIAVYKRRAGD